MKSPITAVLAFAALLGSLPAAAQLTFYQNEGLRGRSFVVDQRIDNFDFYGFNDRASSVVVQRGQWEVCEDADFRGRCVVLRPGQYPSLASVGMNNVISSARPVRGGPNVAYVPPPPVPAPYPFYPQSGERLFEANVVAVRAVLGAPEQRCWVEREQVAVDSGANVGGAIIGGILGGVLGHQIGGGRGNDVATAVGAVGGAAVGANVNRGQRQRLHAGRPSLRGGPRFGATGVLGRDLRLPRPRAPRAIECAAGTDDHRQSPRRTATVGPIGSGGATLPSVARVCVARGASATLPHPRPPDRRRNPGDGCRALCATPHGRGGAGRHSCFGIRQGGRRGWGLRFRVAPARRARFRGPLARRKRS